MIQFEKYQGLGNDFIIPIGTLPPVLQPTPTSAPLTNDLAHRWSKLCDRRYGVGADGVLLKVKDATGALGMHIVNQDGSQAEMCGNGLRCMALHLARHSPIDAKTFEVHTLAGLMKTTVTDVSVQCQIGEAKVQPLQRISVQNNTFEGYFVSTGNPHFVIFGSYDEAQRRLYAPQIERHPSFADGVNVSFATIRTNSDIKLDVFERGCGWTNACGTAATATAAAYWISNQCLGRVMHIQLPGGQLNISGSLDNMVMEGEATFVFEGHFEM